MNRNHSFLLTLCLAIGAAGLSHASAVFVPGDVPDWNQPYQYHPLPAGPGPDPTPAGFDPFDAWCTPTSASNLLGHWEDVYGFPVSDHLPFPGSLPWPGVPPYGMTGTSETRDPLRASPRWASMATSAGSWIPTTRVRRCEAMDSILEPS